jgi:hypothetical protein
MAATLTGLAWLLILAAIVHDARTYPRTPTTPPRHQQNRKVNMTAKTADKTIATIDETTTDTSSTARPEGWTAWQADTAEQPTEPAVATTAYQAFANEWAAPLPAVSDETREAWTSQLYTLRLDITPVGLTRQLPPWSLNIQGPAQFIAAMAASIADAFLGDIER